MIYTLTLNPCIDHHIWLSQEPNTRMPGVLKTFCAPAGKGINVSLMLKTLNCSSTAMGFLGGFTGAHLKDFLETLNIPNHFVSIKEITRINTKLHWPGGESEISGVSPHISSEEWNELFSQISQLKSDDLLILSGSLPGGLAANTYKEIVSLMQAQGTKVLVDASGNALMQAIEAKPYAIKPNHYELAELMGQTASEDVQTNINLAVQLFEKGIEHVIVSLGGAGAILINKEGKFHAQIPQGHVINTVGAGDSLLAGFIAAYAQKKQDPATALALAAACGTATAFSERLAEKKMIDFILKDIKIINLP